MTADALMSRLEGVRQTGYGRWLARCPAHDDRHPSLSVRELDDGRVLVHCFTGCGVGDVLRAVSLQYDALFPVATVNADHRSRAERRPFPASDVLRAIERETLIAAVAASILGQGGQLSGDDRKRLILASKRITAAVVESRHA